MRSRFYNKWQFGIIFICLFSLAAVSLPYDIKKTITSLAIRILPGKTDTGILLPNGWHLTPEGANIPVGTLPLNIAISPDQQYLIVITSGYGTPELDVIDLNSQKTVQRIALNKRQLGLTFSHDGTAVMENIKIEKSWLGLVFSPDGKYFFVSGGADDEVLAFDFYNGNATHAYTIELNKKGASQAGQNNKAFAAGIDISPDGLLLYVVENLSNNIAVISLKEQRVLTKIKVGENPYNCAVSDDGSRCYVTNWGARTVSVIDTKTYSVVGTIQVGDHPNDLVLTRDGKTLFVANANSNTVSVIDTETFIEIESISTALYPRSPIGSTPNAVALSHDERKLYIANADNNNIAVVDVSKRGKSNIMGFIPTGWYPTSVRVSDDGKKIYVANGKGTMSYANPNESIANLLKGSVLLANVPAESHLASLTRKVYNNSPYKGDAPQTPVELKNNTAIPTKAGEPSPIKHVIYVIKENRSYDQIFGDMKEGNGDFNLAIFGEKTTPNHHKLARDFVLLDNFYVNATVSADGHNWSMAAYVTDYIEKTWPTYYSERGRVADYEGSKNARPTNGYIWDYCKRAGITYRSYGEFVHRESSNPNSRLFTNEDALKDHFSPTFPPWDLAIPDLMRVNAWLAEFREFEKNGRLPKLQIIRLPNNHTQGTVPGVPTPRAYVAENDFALGKLVEAVSKSKYWPTTAVFVVEDDAADGPDHIDCHRSVAMAISPYTKRGFVDSTMYSTSSVLRTMELILGLPPMSQYDAGATPMYNSFSGKADLQPFTALPAQVSLNELNPWNAPGAKLSQAMNFKKEDSAPDLLLNQLIWKSIKGSNSVMPAPVRAAFVRAINNQKDDD